MPINKLVLLFIATFLSLGLFAQTESPNHKYIIGGEMGFGFNKNNTHYYGDISEKSFSISPRLARRINNKWTTGFKLDYRYNKVNSHTLLRTDTSGGYRIADTEGVQSTYGVGLFGRYIINPNNALKFFTQGDIDYSQKHTKNNIDGSQGYNHMNEELVFGLSGGLLYDINDRMSLTMRFGGISYTTDITSGLELASEYNNNTFKSDFNLSSLKLGFEYKF